jgi:hypothetical protein
MDSKFLVERADAQIAGFAHRIDGKNENVWCAECAIDDSESPPFVAEETELDLPAFESFEGGSIGPVISEYYDQHAEMEGNDPRIQQDLSDEMCDECGQTLEPQ